MDSLDLSSKAGEKGPGTYNKELNWMRPGGAALSS